MMAIANMLMVGAVLTVVAGQAPGDEQELCTVSLPALGLNVVEDPPNGRILMDSSHYRRLLPPNSDPVWQEVDLDDNNPTGIIASWTEQGSNCESAVTVCGWSGGDQDNWLFTQHINRTVDGYRLQQVSVQIEYQQTTCTDTSVDNTRCRRTFDLLKYEASTVNPVAAMNTSNYALIQTLTTQNSGTTTITMENFGFNTDESGFYLAIRDPGTCIIISRLIVFYNVCPGETVNLVVRPETIAPTVGSLNVNASCVDNSSPVIGDDISLTCLESGNWVAAASTRCECNTGFVPSMNGENCLSCDPGFYASVANGVCLTCPNNSNSTVSGLTECPCDDGYNRTPQEVDLPCTLVECPALAPIPNGAITYDPDMIVPYDVDTVATHTCNDGFHVVGSETRVCLGSGRWSGLTPVCRQLSTVETTMATITDNGSTTILAGTDTSSVSSLHACPILSTLYIAVGICMLKVF